MYYIRSLLCVYKIRYLRLCSVCICSIYVYLSICTIVEVCVHFSPLGEQCMFHRLNCLAACQAAGRREHV